MIRIIALVVFLIILACAAIVFHLDRKHKTYDLNDYEEDQVREQEEEPPYDE